MDQTRVKTFVTAGRAVFTLVSRVSSTRFTYRVTASDDRKVHFVSLLTGPDNTADYLYIGFVRAGRFVHGRKSSVGPDAPSVRAFGWFWAAVIEAQSARALGQLDVHHEGRCGRCGRALTVPESIETGLGPECASKLGL